MTCAELWLTYQLASRAHLKDHLPTTQLIELEFQNKKLADLEDVLDHDDVVVFRQGFVEAKYRPATWWERKDGQKVKGSLSVEELLAQGVGRCPESALKLVVQDVPTALWFTYVYRHGASAPAVAQRVKLAARESHGQMEMFAHLTNYIFKEGFLPAKLRPLVRWEDSRGAVIDESDKIQEVLKFEEGLCEEKPVRLVIDAHPDATPHHGHVPDAMPRRKQYYSILSPPSLSMSELVKTTLDHDSTDMLIDRWLDHRGHGHDPYHDWFRDVRERRHAAQVQASHTKQIIAWNKGEFAPENDVDNACLAPPFFPGQESAHDARCVYDGQLPELMLLRGMHDSGCDEIYIIVTDLKRQEMDDATEYFKLVCRHSFGRPCKPSMERRIRYEHMRLTHTLLRQRRTPCFPQIDLAVRAILYEKQPRFLVLFSHHGTSYSQIFFTHASYVPDEDIFYDWPTGCPNLCCTDDCEMIRFPRHGPESASVLDVRGLKGKGRRKKIRTRPMCNWIDCDVVFSEEGTGGFGGSEGSETSEGSGGSNDGRVVGQTCSKCRLVKYCSADHQRKDWEEHRRVCVKPPV
ncbi:putative MYND finger [Lyophyllum shimeji]|uniref:MYND finger n=1 Tax=Lyophyllum shimeji TaxID=47721 RepID=A0A9P3UMU0_LYOSH|nr:putative MYND finger [Lyophyllum shimeji]